MNLNSQVFFVPWPTSPKSQTVFSKEIRGVRFLTNVVEPDDFSGPCSPLAGDSAIVFIFTAVVDFCQSPIDNDTKRLTKANIRIN